MLFYELHIDASEDELEDIVSVLAEYDDIFEEEDISSDYDFMEDGTYDISDVDELIDMVRGVVAKYPNAGLLVNGSVEDHDYYMDFEVSYASNKLTKRISDWYSAYRICSFNYDDYPSFCEATDLGDRVSEEQFAEWIKKDQDIAVLDSGNGEVVTKAPLSEPIEIRL